MQIRINDYKTEILYSELLYWHVKRQVIFDNSYSSEYTFQLVNSHFQANARHFVYKYEILATENDVLRTKL